MSYNIICEIFKKSVLYGLFVFKIFPMYGQTATEIEKFMPKIDSVMDMYYFANADSALFHLNIYETQAEKNQWKEQLLYAILNKVYVAEHHYLIDSFEIFLHQGDSLIKIFQKKSDKEPFDTKAPLAQEFTYMKGMYYYYQGNFKEAATLFKQAVFDKGELQIKDSLQTFNSLINIGQLYAYDQNFEASRQYYKMAQNILPSASPQYTLIRDHRYQLAFVEMVLAKANFYMNMERRDMRANRRVIQSLLIALEKLGGKEGKPGTHNLFLNLYGMLADVYLELKEYDNAVRYINKGIAISEEADIEQQIKLSYKAGHVYNAKGDYASAGSHISRGQLLADEIFPGRHRLKAMGYFEKGNLLATQKLWSQSILEYQNALTQLSDDAFAGKDIFEIPTANTTSLDNEFLKILLHKAKVFYMWYSEEPNNTELLIAAIETYEQASTVINEIKNGFQSGEAKQFLASIMISSYESAIDAAYEAYQKTNDLKFLEKAFIFAERSKGIQLVDVIKDLSSKSFAGIPESLLEEETRLKGRVFYWQNALIDGDSLQKKQAGIQLFEAREKYAFFVQKLENEFPKYYRLKYKPSSVSIAEVQRKLQKDDQTLFVEYFYGENNLYVFGISSRQALIKRIPVDDAFHHRLGQMLNEISIPNNGASDNAYTEESKYFYSVLIDPLQEILSVDVKDLIIVPDGILGYLPFEILGNGHAKDKLFNFLILNYSISYDYSATVIFEKQLLEDKAPGHNYIGFAPKYASSESVASRAFISSLKYNRNEVEGAEALFGGKVFINEMATEQNFFKYAKEARILHLSMHAKADDNNPVRSAFYFQEGVLNADIANQNDFTQEDGVLYLYELYNLSLQAKLAVLSGCETGSGEYARGEGIMSLGRAFQYAGCPSVAMSLWQINDKSTASLMKDFFENLDRGMPKDNALQQAKIDFLKNPENRYFSHPYYWSAFILMGDSSPVSYKAPFNPMFVLSMVLFLVTSVLVFFIVRKRQRIF